MRNRPFDFETQRLIGQKGETFLDKWLQPNYKVVDVSKDVQYQRSGIDRLITRPDGSSFSVEYKCDLVAQRTGNLFFETISNDQMGTPGWGWTSQADYWIFLIPEREILVCHPGQFRALVWTLQTSLSAKYVPNKGYQTIGYPIPLSQVRTISLEGFDGT